MKSKLKNARPVTYTENTPRVKPHTTDRAQLHCATGHRMRSPLVFFGKTDLWHLRAKIAYDEDLYRISRTSFTPTLYGIRPQEGYLPYLEFEKPFMNTARSSSRTKRGCIA